MDEGQMLNHLKDTERGSAIRANEISTEYTNNLNTINGRVVVIAVGSASLLFTFIGVLFGSSRSTAGLEYKYVVLGIIAFLLSSGLLLANGWFASIFRFKMASKHNLMDRIATRKQEIYIAETNGIGTVRGERLDSEESGAYLEKLKTGLEKMEKILGEVKKSEKFNQLLYRVSLLSGYLVLIAAYILTLIFFIGIINIVNK